MRCAKGICAKGFGGCTRFSLFAVGKRVWDSLLRWKKGSETHSFPRSEHEERGSLRPLFPPQEGVSDPFSHRKRENLVHPPNPLAQIPLAQRMKVSALASASSSNWGGRERIRSPRPMKTRLVRIRLVTIAVLLGPLQRSALTIEAKKTHPKSRNLRSHEPFRKDRAHFCLLSCGMSQEPSRRLLRKSYADELFWYWMDLIRRMFLLWSGISKLMVCQTCGYHMGCLSRKWRKSRKRRKRLRQLQTRNWVLD